MGKADQYLNDGLIDSAGFYLEKASKQENSTWSSNDKILFNSVKISLLTRQGQLEEVQSLADSLSALIQKEKWNVSPDLFSRFKSAIAFNYLSKGRNDLSLDYYKQALVLLDNSQTSKKELIIVYSGLGIVYWNNGNQQLAIDHLHQAQALSENSKGKENTETAGIYNKLGLVYSLENPDEALKNYLKALEIYKASNENHPFIGILNINIGIIYKKKKEYKRAEESFFAAGEINEAIYGKEHPSQAFVYLNLADLYRSQKEYSLAVSYLDDALVIYKKNFGENHPEVANVYNLKGSVLLDENKLKEALTVFEAAIAANMQGYQAVKAEVNPPIKNYYNADILLSSLMQKSRTYEELYQTKTLKLQHLLTAFSSIQSCDTLLRIIREIRSNKNDKIALGSISTEVYEHAVRICYALSEVTTKPKKYIELAATYAEKSKSTVLQEAISEVKAKQYAGIPPEELEKENQLKEEITYNSQKLAQKPEPAMEKTYRDNLFRLNREYENFVKELEKSYPKYYNLKYNKTQIGRKEIQAALSEQTALVSYFIAYNNRRIYAFVYTKNQFKAYSNPLPEDFEKKITAFRNGILYRLEDVNTLGLELKEILLPFTLNSKITNLVIIPEGRLGTIPFEALKDKKNNYMVNRYAMSYGFSTALFVSSGEYHASNSGSKNQALLCAPVNFKSPNNNLPSSLNEIEDIDAIFKGKSYSSNRYIYADAIESVFKTATLKNYSFLHFATHGVVDENNPELSSIILSADSTGKDDGILYSGEIFNLNISARLVTLSACQTGLGKISKGEGIIGLSRALFYAGAENLVVSLWKVADRSTAELMTDFYTSFLEKNQIEIGLALQKAKVNMLQSKDYKDPYFWAPFVLIGR